jgi:hypothetical protein
MAEGGMLAWKRQVVDNSRGPAGSYKNMSLPDLPEGVVWQQNTETKDWTLVASDPDAISRRKYRMERSTVWNARTGREQLTVRMLPVGRQQQQQGIVQTKNKTLVDGDDETVATDISAGINNDDDEYYFNESSDGRDGDEVSRPPEPVLGVDYIIHTVLPADTFQGLVRSTSNVFTGPSCMTSLWTFDIFLLRSLIWTFSCSSFVWDASFIYFIQKLSVPKVQNQGDRTT